MRPVYAEVRRQINREQFGDSLQTGDKSWASYLGRDRLLVQIISERHVNGNDVISLTLFSLRFDIAIRALTPSSIRPDRGI